MALGNRRASCAIAPEATFGSLSSGIPDASGLTYIVMEVYRTSINYTGQIEPAAQLDIARNGTGRYAPETEAPYVSGTKQRRRFGDVTISGPLRCPGSTAMASTAMHLVLNTVMTRPTARGAGASDTINDVTPTVYECQVTSPGAAQIGELLAFEIGGNIEIVRVTGTNGGAGPLTWAPSLSAAPNNGSTFRYCNTYFPALGDLAFATFKSVAIRRDLHGKRQYAVGCRLKSLVIETGGTDERTVRYTATFRAAAIYDADSSASPENPTITSGGIAKFLETGGAVYTPNIATEAAPANSVGGMTRTLLSARRWSLELSWELQDAGHGGSYLAASEWTAGDFTAALKFPGTDPADAFDDSRSLNEYRMWTVPNGPSNGAGNGFGVNIPAGFMPEFVEPEVEDRNRFQSLTIHDGPYTGDVGTEAQANALDKSACIGFVA